MNYHTDEDGITDFNQNASAATTAEDKVADYYRSKGFTVVNQGVTKKTDLLITNQNGQSTLLEIKDNWKDTEELIVVIENNSVRYDGDMWSNDGWIYTSKCNYIGFVNSNTNKMLLAYFPVLQVAFKEVIKLPMEGEPELKKYGHAQTESKKDGRRWNSSYILMAIEDLKAFGATFKLINLTIPPVAVQVAAPVPVIEEEPEVNEIIDEHIADTTNFQDERSKWLEQLNDGFLDDKTIKSMMKKFS